MSVGGYQDCVFYEEALAAGAEQRLIANDIAFLENLRCAFCHVHSKTMQWKTQVPECIFGCLLRQHSFQSTLVLLDVA